MSAVGWGGSLVGWHRAGAIEGQIADLEASVATNTANITALQAQANQTDADVASLQGGAITLYAAHATGSIVAGQVAMGAIVRIPLTALVTGHQFPATGVWSAGNEVVSYASVVPGLYQVACSFSFTVDLPDLTVYFLDLVEGTGLDTGSPTIRTTLTSSYERTSTVLEETLHVIGFVRLEAGGGQLSMRISHSAAATVTVDGDSDLSLHRVLTT